MEVILGSREFPSDNRDKLRQKARESRGAPGNSLTKQVRRASNGKKRAGKITEAVPQFGAAPVRIYNKTAGDL